MQNLKEIIQTLGGDPYQILQTSPQAEPHVLRKNYRVLAAKYHPDKNKQENAKMIFIKINQAYEFLESESNRNLYKSQIKALQEQRKKMQSMDQNRRKLAQDLRRRQQEYLQRQKDMQKELKRRKQFYRKKMEQEEQKQKLRTEIASSIGSQKYYQMVCSCTIKWEDGFSFTENMLKLAFSKYGKINDINIETKRNFANFKFDSIEDCTNTVNSFRHPMISIDFKIGKQKRDNLLKALTVQKSTKIDLSLNSENIARIKQIMNRNSTLYRRQQPID